MFGLLHQVIAFVKDEGTNLIAMATIVKLMPSYFTNAITWHNKLTFE
jgi:hypothetical protein